MVKSSLKLNRLMGIIPKNERQILMNLIHPDLFRYLNLFSDSMEQVLKIPIEKLLSIKTKAEIEFEGILRIETNQKKLLERYSDKNLDVRIVELKKQRDK